LSGRPSARWRTFIAGALTGSILGGLIGIGGTAELSRSGARRAPLGQRLAGRGELLDAIVASVADIHISLVVNGNAARVIELAWAAAKGAPGAQEISTRGELLNAVIRRICHVQVADRIEGDGAGSAELSGSSAGRRAPPAPAQ